MQVATSKGVFYVNMPAALCRRLTELCKEDCNLDQDFSALLLHLILTHHHHEDEPGYDEGWLHLSSNFLRKFNHKGFKYNEQRDLLEAYGIIETRPHLNLPDVQRCMGYKIKDDFNYNPNEELRSQEYCHSHTAVPIHRAEISTKLNRIRKLYSVRADYTTSHLTKWLDSKNFYIDEVAAISFIESKYKSEKQRFQYRKRINSVCNFEDINFYKREGKDHRLHTYFTRLPKDLMPYLTHVSGARLVEIDVKSSQPFIFSVLLEIIENHYKNNTDIGKNTEDNRLKNNTNNQIYKSISKDITNKVNTGTGYHLDINIIIKGITNISPKTLKDPVFIEISSFKNSIRERDFYHQLGNDFYLRGAIIKKDDLYVAQLYDKGKGYVCDQYFTSIRDAAKRVVLNALYATGPAKTKCLKLFKQLYPEVSKILDALKSHRPEDLPILMQQIEAHCILDYCTKRIAKQYPDMLLLTKHDSVTTTEDRAEELYVLLCELLKDFFGLPVKTSIKYWSGEEFKISTKNK